MFLVYPQLYLNNGIYIYSVTCFGVYKPSSDTPENVFAKTVILQNFNNGFTGHVKFFRGRLHLLLGGNMYMIKMQNCKEFYL
jgi:hypothetical protein